MNARSGHRSLTVVGRLALLMLVLDIMVGAVMLAILRAPVPVFVTLAIINAASLISLRGQPLTEPRH